MRLHVTHSNFDLTLGASFPFPDLQTDIAERLGSDGGSGPRVLRGGCSIVNSDGERKVHMVALD
jgi:hypothetical protein